MTKPTSASSGGSTGSVASPSSPVPESALRWHQYITLTFPYFWTSWRWLNGAFLVIFQHRAYRYIATVWTQVISWLNTREGWHFMRPTEQYQLLKWVQSRMAKRSIVVTNFNDDWKDGVALCALIDDLVPGTCPRHDLLHPKQERLNIELGLRLAEMHLGVISDITPGEILCINEETERKFQRLIARLRAASPLRHNSLLHSPRDEFITLSERSSKNVSCFAKGMGLLMGVEGKKARFNIYLHTNECMDIVIELEGATNKDYCSERITVRSPRKKESNPIIKNYPAAVLVGDNDTDHDIGELASGRTVNIPLEYEVMNGQIAVNYTPPNSGRYKLAIISRGRHIFGSPFTIAVDVAPAVIPPEAKLTANTTALQQEATMKFLAVGLPRRDSDISNLDAADMAPLRSDTPNGNAGRPYGKVTSRRLLRSIVFRNGENVVLEGDATLPRDPRAWSAVTNSSCSVEVSDEEVDFGTADTKLVSTTTTTTTTVDNIYFVPRGIISASLCPADTTTDGSVYAATTRSNTPSTSYGCESVDESGRRPSMSDGETLDDLIEEYRKIAELFQGMKDEKMENLEATSDYDSLQASQSEQTDPEPEEMLHYVGINKEFAEPPRGVVTTVATAETTRIPLSCYVQPPPATTNGHVGDCVQSAATESYFRQSPSPGNEGSLPTVVRNTPIFKRNLSLDLEKVNTNTEDRNKIAVRSLPQRNICPKISRSILPRMCSRSEFIAIANGLTNQRVPDALINDWVTLWNVEGEGIVKTRVKEWEKTLHIAEEDSSYSKIIRAECLPLAKVVTGQVQSVRRTLSEEMRKSRSAESINNCHSFEALFGPTGDKKAWILKRTNSTIVNGDTKLNL